jgi:DNA end-binding protein Ku
VDTAATFGEPTEEKSGGEVIDLMEALRKSVEKNRADAAEKKGSSGKKKKAKSRSAS